MYEIVKMKLIQPAIKCSGRRNVVCYYKGKVVEISNDKAFILFKQRGESILGMYDMTKEEFVHREMKDIKLL